MKKPFLSGYKTYDTSNGYGSAKKWKKAFNERMSTDEAQQIIDDQEKTPHAILGVSMHASQVEIKAAFRKMMMEWHPDRNPHRVMEAEAMSKKIIAAYTVLSK